jgi:tripeptide aminopeptidase
VIDRQRLLNRFLEYVRYDTAADPNSHTYPSSPGQKQLGEVLCRQLRQMGIANAHQDEFGLVWATIPSNVGEAVPAVLLNSHLDSYAGGAIPLENNQLAITAEHCPGLAGLVGKTLVTTDGQTLLGGDDKAGVAVIMELAECLMSEPTLAHGSVQILFTCDEEIGHGTDHIDMRKIIASVGYTLDGSGLGEIDEETFSADLATIHFRGQNIHPSIGKGRMVNAVRAAGLFLAQLPRDHLSPETTEGREGFIHPYDIRGGVGEACLQVLLRDFDSDRLTSYRQLLIELGRDVEKRLPGLQISVETQSQYRNMADGLKGCPAAVQLAEQAYQRLGIIPRRTIVRGGTDGSMLTAKGLPTPNLSVGQYNIHSVREFVCLDHMVIAAQHLVELLQLWSRAALPCRV